MVFDCYVMNIIIFGTDTQMNKIDPVRPRHIFIWSNLPIRRFTFNDATFSPLSVNHFSSVTLKLLSIDICSFRQRVSPNVYTIVTLGLHNTCIQLSTMVYIIVFTITLSSYHQGFRCRGRRDAFSPVTTLICSIIGGSVSGSRGIFI